MISLAENIEQGEALREVIYLMHEGYLNTQGGATPDIEELSMVDDAATPDSDTEDTGDTAEMYKLIEQFTEESAELVERIYMLNNENKMLGNENEDLKKQIKDYTDQVDTDEDSKPIIAGLKMKIESQKNRVH